MGIEVRFVDPADPEAFRRATDASTRAYYAETLPNPKLKVFPIGEVAAIGRVARHPPDHGQHRRAHHLPPAGARRRHRRPFHHQVHRRPRHLDRRHHRRRRQFRLGRAQASASRCSNEPDPSYHGAVWTEAVKPLGPIAYIIRARVVLLRDIGACMSPFNAFQFIQGLETLPLRMREHCRNAAEVALYLQRHPQVTRVIYAGHARRTPSSAGAPSTYLKGGFGGLVGFELKAGREAGARFIDALKLFYHVANIGDARSLAIHPASTTHSQLTGDEQLATGVTPGYVRLSVGIEHIDDIIADLDQALSAATASLAQAAEIGVRDVHRLQRWASRNASRRMWSGSIP